VAAKLVVIMVGLPARGKSYITKKIQRYMSWQQHNTEVFNVGNRRRVAATKAPAPEDLIHDADSKNDSTDESNRQPKERLVNNYTVIELSEPTELNLNSTAPPKEEQAEKKPMDQSASFFDPRNEEATKLREQLALDTLDELLDYLLHRRGAVGILDATNSTISRRKHLIDRIREREPKIPILFIESVCDDRNVSITTLWHALSSPKSVLANRALASRGKHALEAIRTRLQGQGSSQVSRGLSEACHGVRGCLRTPW
jgi:6-phosphofructo-2-kinase